MSKFQSAPCIDFSVHTLNNTYKCAHINGLISSNGWHSGPIFFKPEKNLEFFRLKNWPRDSYPGKLE